MSVDYYVSAFHYSFVDWYMYSAGEFRGQHCYSWSLPCPFRDIHGSYHYECAGGSAACSILYRRTLSRPVYGWIGGSLGASPLHGCRTCLRIGSCSSLLFYSGSQSSSLFALATGAGRHLRGHDNTCCAWLSCRLHDAQSGTTHAYNELLRVGHNRRYRSRDGVWWFCVGSFQALFFLLAGGTLCRRQCVYGAGS